MPPKRNKKGQYEIQFSQGGRRIHRVLPEGTTRVQAQELETKLRRKVFDADELGHVPDYTIGEAVMRYLSEFRGKAQRQTANHAKALAGHIRGRTLGELGGAGDSVRGDQSVSLSTRNRRLAILRRVGALAYGRWGWLEKPVKIEMLPENPARDVRLSRDELAALIWKVKNRTARRAIYAAAFTGLRKGELLGLEPDDIRGNVICLADTKTGSPRNVPIIRSASFCFRRLPFSIDPYYLSHVVRRASAGRVRFHDLRHTTASLLINAGVPLHTVGAILGHKSLQTTKRYAHYETKTLGEALSRLEPSRQLPAPKSDKDEKAA